MVINYIWKGLVYLLIVFIFQVTLSGFARKIVARIQKRYGPPIIQNFWDIFKLLVKKSSISHGFIFEFGIWMALGGTLATVIFMYWGDNIINWYIHLL